MGKSAQLEVLLLQGFIKFAALRGFSGNAGEMEGMMLACGMEVIEAPSREMPGH